MNFEDQLKTMTLSQKNKEMEEKLKAEERQQIYKQQTDLLLTIKSDIESEFKSVIKYFPNASVHPTHSIENGKVVPHMGTFYCCLLEFKKNSLYEFTSDAIIGILVSISDSMNISLYSSALAIEPNNANYYATILRQLQFKESYGNCYFDGPYDKDKIISLSQPQILECINELKQSN